MSSRSGRDRRARRQSATHADKHLSTFARAQAHGLCCNALRPVAQTVRSAVGFVEAFGASEASLTSRRLKQGEEQTRIEHVGLLLTLCVSGKRTPVLLVAPYAEGEEKA